MEGDEDAVCRLLRGKSGSLFELNKWKIDTTSPLHAAVAYEEAGMVDALVAAGADMNQAHTMAFWKMEYGDFDYDRKLTPLQFASMMNDDRYVVSVLVTWGVDVNKDESGLHMTALDLAAKYGEVDVMDELLKAGATSDPVRSPLYMAVERGRYGNIDMVNLLLKSGFGFGQERCMIAAKNNTQMLQTLIEHEIQIEHAPSTFKYTKYIDKWYKCSHIKYARK